LALIVFFSVNSQFFLSTDNFINIIRQVAIIGICAAGMTFVILTGGIDLSTGSILGMAAAVAARLMVNGTHPVTATLVALALGVIFGLVNGFFINKIGLPPLITTLGTMTALRGATMLITDGRGIHGITRAYRVIGQGYIGPIPIPAIIMVTVFVLGYILLEKTKFGRYVYGIGDNEEATRLSGVDVKKIRYAVYAFSGFLSALAGIVFLSRLMSAQPTAGQGYELEVITAVVLGGVSIKGGEGKISLVIVGVIIMGVLVNGLIMMNINAFWQFVVRGLVLLLAVSYDRFMLMHRNKIASS
jgi:ribose/xylose/arabinose/galactoside ABC-type transport system permease subunit